MKFKLYKVLGADGRGAFSIGGPAWPLPTKDTPGEWIERLNDKPGSGIYVTPCPTRWRANPGSELVFEVEVDAVEGDPELSHAVTARRVRLIRLVGEAEVLAASEAWNAEFRRRNGEK